MKLVVQIRSCAIRRWHISLLSRLAARLDTIVALDYRGCVSTPRGVDTLMQLEALLYRVPRPGLATPETAGELARFRTDTEDADLILALDAPPEGSAGTPAWQLAFDDGLGEPALLGALMARRPPLVSLVDRAAATVAAGRPGSEAGGVLLQALEDTLARVTTLILAALDGTTVAAPHGDAPVSPSPPRPIAAAAGKILVNAVIRRIYTLCYNAPHWRVGWRAAPGADLLRDLSTEGAPWRVLPDDGHRFYADPFAMTIDGITTLFVEEFPHATGKGIISAVTLGPDGPAGPPRPVLETGTHLSYPHVFAHDGAIWMVPESSGERCIALYRATAFPGGWVREATLVDDIVASDATLVRHGGRWWMFATVRDGGGAFSDALYLWSSPHLQGPWQTHPHNPVLVDIASARPAGAFVVQGDALLRPVQDCRRGYGAALGIARITRLDDKGFSQEMQSVAQGEGWRGRLHTYNRCGAFELIDGSARVLKRIGPAPKT